MKKPLLLVILLFVLILIIQKLFSNNVDHERGSDFKLIDEDLDVNDDHNDKIKISDRKEKSYTPFSISSCEEMDSVILQAQGYKDIGLETIEACQTGSLPSCPSTSKCNKNHVSEVCLGDYKEEIFPSNVYFFQNVFSDPSSRIWSSSEPYISLVKPSCYWPDKPIQKHVVTKKLQIAISLQSKYQHIYFHYWTEFLIGLMMIKPYMEANPEVPVLIREETSELDLARKMVGIDHLPTKFIYVKDTIFVNKLVVPLVPVCWRFDEQKKAFPNLLYNKLRENARIHFGVNDIKPSKILIEQRKGKRSLEQFDKLKDWLFQHYPAESIQVIGPDTVPIGDSAKYFSDAAIYIAPHGSGFTNMIFMKQDTSVIEISPVGWNTILYQKMCDVFQINHFKIVAHGGFATSINMNATSFGILLQKSKEMIEQNKYLQKVHFTE